METFLRQEQPDVVVVSRVPNRRLSGSGAALRFLRDADPSTTVGELRHYLRRAGSDGVDPETLWELGDAVPYHVDLSWSGLGADDRVDLFLIKKDQPGTGVPASSELFGSGDRPCQAVEPVARPGGEAPKVAIPGVGFIQYCQDTEGNTFGVMQFDEAAS
jgi:hypothetical protein